MRTPTCHGKQNPDCTARYHGTRSAYTTFRCRCPHAHEAVRLYNKRNRQQRNPAVFINPIGTARRIQGMHADGWTWTALAQRLNCTDTAIHHWAVGKYKAVHRDTAHAVAALSRDLADTPGPCDQARQRAAAKGWVGVDAWLDIDDPNSQPIVGEGVDDVLVQRAVGGNLDAARTLNRAERLEAARRLIARGLGSGGVSARLNVSSKTARRLIEQVAA